MPPKKGTVPWIPEALPWEAARFSADGTLLRLIYVIGSGPPADTANVRREEERLTVTLSRMRRAGGGRLAARYHCAEVTLAERSTDLILIDGATGERADAKSSRYVDPEKMRNQGWSLDELFEPSEHLIAREFGPT